MPFDSEPLRPGPDFMGIGVPRAGTTWLYETLRREDGIWLPPIKELHYFDSLDPIICKDRHTDRQSHRWRRFALSRARHYAARLLPSNREPVAIKTDAPWDKHFFGPGGDPDWYAGLFRAAASKGYVTGEITPDYCLLSDETLQHMLAINPQLRLILILRDPIARTWSNAVFYVTRKTRRTPASLSDEDWISVCERPACLERSDYPSILTHLRHHIDSDRLFLGYFDQIKNDPDALITALRSFLGLPRARGLRLRDRGRVNAAASGYTIPKAVEAHLARRFIGPLTRLECLTDGAAAVSSWRRRAYYAGSTSSTVC